MRSCRFVFPKRQTPRCPPTTTPPFTIFFNDLGGVLFDSPIPLRAAHSPLTRSFSSPHDLLLRSHLIRPQLRQIKAYGSRHKSCWEKGISIVAEEEALMDSSDTLPSSMENSASFSRLSPPYCVGMASEEMYLERLGDVDLDLA